MTKATLRLVPHPESVRASRTFVQGVLSDSAASRHSDDAALLVGELVSNAVLHAGTPIELTVAVEGTNVRIEVLDESEHMPEKVTAAGDMMGGRGLHIVEAIAKRWGANRVAGRGKKVWFEVSDA